MHVFRNMMIAAVFAAFPGAAPQLLSQSAGAREQQIQSHSGKAGEFLKANRPDLAANEFRAIIALDPNNADAHANLGVITFFQGDYTTAAPELRLGLKLRPDLWKIQALLGLCERQLGDMDRARADLERSFPHLDEEKLRVEAGMKLTEIYYAAGDLDRAAATVTVLKKLRPVDPDILYTAHRVYADLADECMLSVAIASPESARMRQMMGNEMARRANIAGAIAQYREALKKEPHLPGLHFQLAEMLSLSSSVGDRDQAQREYQVALAENPLDVRSQCRLGEIAIATSDLKTAVARYSRAIELQPNDAEANLGLAKALMAMGEDAKAEAYLLRAAASEPFDAATHMRLATVYRKSGRAADAARELAEFERLKGLQTRLGDVYREMSVRLPRGERPDENARN